MPEEQRRRVVGVLYRSTWGIGEGVTDPERVARALRDAGLPGDELVASAGTHEAKARLREQTSDALRRGIFGVPSMEVEGSGEVFWGQDAIPHLERYLDGEDPVSPELLAQWQDLPGSHRPALKR